MTRRSEFLFGGTAIPFLPGETVASALEAARVTNYGPDALGGTYNQFCGVGACQRCLLRVDGVVVEACLTPASDGLQVEPVHGPMQQPGSKT